MSAARSPTSCIATWTPASSPFTRSPRRPDDPSRGIIQGIAEICRDNGVAAGDIDYVLHGTTTATNAVLEHKGARAGMLTNEGFRDIIHIARHQRVEHYSIMQELPWQNRPLVKRRHRKVVKGRLVPPHGEELEPLDEAGVRCGRPRLESRGGRSGRGLLPVLLPQPGARGARQGNPRARTARRLHHDLVIGLAAVPRVRALHHRLPVRVHRTEDARLYRPSRRCAARRRAALRFAGDGFERRRGHAGHGQREAGDDVAVGARRRRPRRRLGRRLERTAQARHLRHRRHQRRHRHCRRRPLCRDRCAQHLDRRLPAAAADDRHPHHRRRRRLDRLYRSWRRLPRRAAQRRRGAGPGRLWARRQRSRP